jgi:HlyD family secretion protein
MTDTPRNRNQLFRKAPLERLSSPEQLDQLMPVTTPLSWLGLVAAVLVLAAALLWGIWGEIPSKVHGQGILLKKESLYDVISLGTGRIESLSIQVDDVVDGGRVLATLSQPDMDHEIKEAENVLKNLEAEKHLLESLGTRTIELKNEYFQKQQLSLQDAIKANEQRIEFFKGQIEEKKNLLQKGQVTHESFQSAINEYEKALQEIRNHRAEINNLSARQVEMASQREKDLRTIEYRIDQAKETIRALKEKLDLHSRVICPRAGRILEIYKDVGKVINTGEPLVNMEVIEEEAKPLSAFLYFHPIEGKRIKPGMRVHVSPSVVKQEEYGNIVGKVTQVSGFPASQRGMLRALRNEDLVKSLCAGGAPIVVTIALIPDRATPSGYRWSSGSGPPIAIQSGTICSAAVVIRKQTPASLVLPFLKKHLLGTGDSHVETGN